MKPFWRAAAALFAAAAALAMAEQPLRDWGGKPTPPLALTDLAGKPVDLARLRGRVVLVNFWATWCEPCIAEMPVIKELAQRHPDVDVVLVNVDHHTVQAPRVGLNMFRPRIHAPRFRRPRSAKSLSIPVVPSASGPRTIFWKTRVGKNHSCRFLPPTPSGFSRL